MARTWSRNATSFDEATAGADIQDRLRVANALRAKAMAPTTLDEVGGHLIGNPFARALTGVANGMRADSERGKAYDEATQMDTAKRERLRSALSGVGGDMTPDKMIETGTHMLADPDTAEVGQFYIQSGQRAKERAGMDASQNARWQHQDTVQQAQWTHQNEHQDAHDAAMLKIAQERAAQVAATGSKDDAQTAYAKWFLGQSPDVQHKVLLLHRGDPKYDTGNQIIVGDPLNPTQPQATIGKGLAPADQSATNFAPGAAVPTQSAPVIQGPAGAPPAAPEAAPPAMPAEMPPAGPTAPMGAPPMSQPPGLSVKATNQVGKEMAVNRMKMEPKARNALVAFKTGTNNAKAAIDRAKALVGPFTSGAGSVFQNLPATQARALRDELNTAKANISIQSLQEMRQNSPTGGALGNVSDHEGNRLESIKGTLDQGLASGKLLETLDLVSKALDESTSNVENAYQQTWGQPGAQPSAPAADYGHLSDEQVKQQLGL